MAGMTGFPIGGGSGRLTMGRTLHHGSDERGSRSTEPAIQEGRQRSRDRRSASQPATELDLHTIIREMGTRVVKLENKVQTMSGTIDGLMQWKQVATNEVEKRLQINASTRSL